MLHISTYATHQLSLLDTTRTQSRMQEMQLQIASGKVARDYTGIASDSRRLLSMEAAHTRTDGFISNIDTAARRLSATENAVARTHDLAVELRTLLLNAINPENAEDLALDERADNMLMELQSLLNLERDERFLFAGSRTDTTPVDFSAFDPKNPIYDPLDPTPANAGYYDGDTKSLSIHADESLTLDYGVTASEPAFEALARALFLARDGGAPGQIDRPQLEQALQLAQSATDDIPDIRSRIGAVQLTLEATKERHLDAQLYAEEHISSLEDADVAEVLTRLSAARLQLEGSYSVTARLSQISLMQYLR